MRKSILTLAAFLAFSLNAYAQPTFLTYEKMKPITGIFSACWKLSVQNPKVDCEKLVAALVRTVSNSSRISERDIVYAHKYLENIMFAEWYDEAVSKGMPWNKSFADAENLSIACVEKYRNIYLTIDCMNEQVRPNLKRAWDFLNGKSDKPTAQESAEINRYFVQTMFACMHENATKEDTRQMQLDCLDHVDKTVDKLSGSRTFTLLLASYLSTYNWLKANQPYVPFDNPDAIRTRCLEVTDSEKLNCILKSSTEITSYGQNIAKAISKPFASAFQ